MRIITVKSAKEHKRTSQYLGVNWDKQYERWKASISVNGRKKILGYFVDETEAARSFNDAAKKHGRDSLNILPLQKREF